VKIHKTEEIDHEKLNALFKRRGRKITMPLFTKRVVDILETSDKEFEVHQCRCGEVVIFRTEYADHLRQKLNTEDIPCNSCLGLDDLKISGQIFVKLSNILQLMERRKIDRGRNRVDFIEDDFEQLKKEAKGLFATQTLNEFYYSFYNFTNTFFDEIKGKESHVSYPLISEIVESALKINPNILKEVGDDVDAAIEFDAATLNIYLVNKSRFDLLSKISDEKFSKSEISEFHEIRTSYSKFEIKSKMIEYKDLVEVKNYLNLLLNLINVIEGRQLVPNPFKKLKLPPMNPRGKERKISGINGKIELFKHHSYGDRLYPLLSDIFDLRLRNDEAHNTYEIDIDRRTIRSTKYDKETTFEELDEKIEKISSFHSFLSNEWVNKYHESLKPNLKNCGIEALTLGYEDPTMIGNRLFPNDNCMSELEIYQYWDFAYYENERRWIPIPNLSIDDGEFIISFENGNKFNYKLDSDVELWLDQSILHEAYNLCLYTIAPLIPSFNVKSKIKLPIGGLFEVNILEIEEKVIELPTKLTHDFSKKISI
jgi:hypothetical protein